MQTAFVTQLTRPIAEQLAGGDAAAEIDALVDSGLLRRVGSAANEAFEAHGLVQQGMRALVHRRLDLLRRAISPRELRQFWLQTTRRKPRSRFLPRSARLRAHRCLRQLAERYAAQGQVDLLLGSIAKLPTPEVQRDAWLCFWTGQALLRVDEEQARIWFARSYSAFEAASDSYGMRVAAASNVTAFLLECGDLRELDMWVERHRTAGGDTPVPSGDRFETTLTMGIVCAALVCARYPSANLTPMR